MSNKFYSIDILQIEDIGIGMLCEVRSKVLYDSLEPFAFKFPIDNSNEIEYSEHEVLSLDDILILEKGIAGDIVLFDSYVEAKRIPFLKEFSFEEISREDNRQLYNSLLEYWNAYCVLDNKKSDLEKFISHGYYVK